MEVSITFHLMGGYTGSEFLEQFSIVTQSGAAGSCRVRKWARVAKVSGLKSSRTQLCSAGTGPWAHSAVPAGHPCRGVSEPSRDSPPSLLAERLGQLCGEAQLGASPVVKGCSAGPGRVPLSGDENQTPKAQPRDTPAQEVPELTLLVLLGSCKEPRAQSLKPEGVAVQPVTAQLRALPTGRCRFVICREFPSRALGSPFCHNCTS